MSRPMPTDQPFLSGNGIPTSFEGDCHDIPVTGEVPSELRGTYFRNGSNPQFAPRGAYHLFDGDGMIHAFFFEEGRVGYRNRWVRTERFLLERQAGHALFGSMTEPGSSDPSVLGVSSNAANTSVFYHGGKLLALWEGGLPTQIDPETLETDGLWDFEGELRRPFDPALAVQFGIASNESEGGTGIMTAHPKFDPKTGEMLFFGASASPPNLLYYVAAPDGRLIRKEEVEVPFSSMMHDFAVTEDYVVFGVFPGVFDFEAMAAGTALMSWKPELGSHIGVMPRSGSGSDTRWFQCDPCFVFHFANAHSEGERVITEQVRFDQLPLFGGDGMLPPSLWRWTIDLAGGSIKEEQIDATPTEFPRIDDRYCGLPYRYIYGPAFGEGAAPGPLGFNGIVRFDVKSGERVMHQTGAGSVVGEPVFIPRSADAQEGDGFVLDLVYRDQEKRSDLIVLDAQNMAGEPLATLHLPVRVPAGFHGSWKPAD